MNLNIYTYRIQSFLQEAKNVLILLRREPDLDSTAGALSLYLSLIQRGKQVTIVCPDKMTVSLSNLFAVDKVTDELGRRGKNLVISFPYVEGSIEKVSYNIENNRFNLVIEPRGEGTNLLNKDNVEFSASGEGADNFDLIFTIGVSNSNDLGKLQSVSQKLLAEKTVIAIDNKPQSSPFGTISLNNPGSATLSEVITLLLTRLNLPIDRDIAGNLLAGIKEKTDNFTKGTVADTFEAVAICMRKTVSTTYDKTQQWVPHQSTQFTPQPQKSTNAARMGPSNVKKAPPDWLKPKIFRSSEQNLNPDDSDNGTIL